MAKTKWIIEPSTLTIYPKLRLRMVGIVFFILFLALIFILSKILNVADFNIGYGLILLLIPICFILIAETKVIFDGHSKKLYEKIGFIKVGAIPFDNIAAVKPYTLFGNSYNYRLFKKSNQYGKGLVITSSFNDPNDINYIQFQQEVLPKIQELVFGDTPIIQKEKIYSFKYFKEESGVYLLKQNKIGGIIFGFIFLGITIAILLNHEFMANEPAHTRIILTYFPSIIGLVFLIVVFSNLRFDKNQREIIVSHFGGLIERTYSFDNFIRYQIIRKTTNFIYSGTDVNAEINLPEKNKIKILSLKSFVNTKKIDGFLDEVDAILGKV